MSKAPFHVARPRAGGHSISEKLRKGQEQSLLKRRHIKISLAPPPWLEDDLSEDRGTLSGGRRSQDRR